MIAELNYPLETLRGNLTKEHYARVLYGKVVIQRRPKRDKPPTEAQKRAREAFAKKYAGKHSNASLAFPVITPLPVHYYPVLSPYPLPIYPLPLHPTLYPLH